MPQDTQNINPILQSAKAAQSAADAEAAIVTAANKKISQTDKASALTDKIVEATKEKAAADSAIATQTAIAELKLQKARNAIWEAGGGLEAAVALRKEQKKQMEEQAAAAAEVEAIQNREVGGIIDYFKQQFALADAERKLYNESQDVARVSSNIAQFSASQESLTRAVNTTRQSVTSGTIAAGERQIALQAQIAASKEELAGLATNSAALTAAIGANEAILRSINSAENRAIRKEEIAVKRERLDFEKSMRPITLAAAEVNLASAKEALSVARATNPSRVKDFIASVEEAEKRRNEAEIVESNRAANVSAGQAMLGLNPEDRATITNKAERGTAKDKAIYEIYRYVGATGSFGATPSEAYANIQAVGAGDTPATRRLRELAYSYSTTYTPQTAPKNQEEWNNKFDKYIKDEAAEWSANIAPLDPNNPYSTKSFGEVAEFKAVRESKTYKVAWEPAELKEFNPVRIYSTALDAIDAEQLTIEEATQDIVTVFEAAIASNNIKGMFDRIGVPEQESYFSRIIEPPFGSEVGSPVSGAVAGSIVADVSARALKSGSVPRALAVIAGGFAGYQFGKLRDSLGFGLTNNVDPVAVRATLVKLKAERDGGTLKSILNYELKTEL